MRFYTLFSSLKSGAKVLLFSQLAKKNVFLHLLINTEITIKLLKMKKLALSIMTIAMLATVGCKSNKTEEKSEIQQKVDEYAEFTLTTDLSVLSEKEKQLLPIFIQIADIMDDLYWDQYFGPENRANLDTITDPAKSSQYTVIRRDENGALKVVPYHVEYADRLAKVDSLMGLAIDLAEDPGLKNYLTERRKALMTDDYYASDLAWMDM